MLAIKETNWDLIVSGEDLEKIANIRGKEFTEDTVLNSELDSYIKKGWQVKKQLKTKSYIYKEKKLGDGFEDEVWMIFKKMGFKQMNKDNSFAIAYNSELGLSKQIDVLAIDEETCIFVECKDASDPDTKRNFQKDINEIPTFYKRICDEVRKKYGQLKFRYIFATKNLVLGDQDKNRLKDAKIIHFDYAAVLYYKALVSHLGSAAKYQLLGQIFAGQKIGNMDVAIPAIRGKMGGLTYYSFIMSPEKLLKISYVLHKTNANNEYDDLLPSYQRLIKKERLQSVREFINAGNYFPNSIVISIDSKKPLTFDLAGGKNGDNLSKMGILHLPQIYQSVYIIDGQHRLYGYSDSKYVDNNSIPVVAFENLDKKQQLKLFMEINLNQKAVPKALRNILEIDVYYDSEKPNLAQSALFGNIAKRLGEDTASVLKGRVIIGEDAGTNRCCITIENIKLALAKTNFFNKLKNNGSLQPNGEGLFDKGNNPETFKTIYPIILKYINRISDEFSSEWTNDDSFFVKNNIVGAYIRLLDDIIGIEYKKEQSIIDNFDLLFEKCEHFISLLIDVLRKLTPNERDQIIKQRGASAPTQVYRLLEMKMYESDSSFSNPDIENYYIEKYKDYNDEAKPEIINIHKILIEYLRSIFTEKDWMRKHLSEAHENDLTNRVHSKNNYNSRNGIEQTITEWDEIGFVDFQKIIVHASNWTEFFKDKFNKWLPDATKNDISALMFSINKCNDNIRDGHKITGSEFNDIDKLYKAMIGE